MGIFFHSVRGTGILDKQVHLHVHSLTTQPECFMLRRKIHFLQTEK